MRLFIEFCSRSSIIFVQLQEHFIFLLLWQLMERVWREWIPLSASYFYAFAMWVMLVVIMVTKEIAL